MRTAVFTKGSTLRHILVMTGASTVGLVTMFTVDLVDIYFLSLLGNEALPAAVGFASTLLFFFTSVSIGLQIAMGALVARAEGSSGRERAKLYCTNVCLFSAVFSCLVCLPAWLGLEALLSFLGAEGETLEFALAYSNILLPASPLLALGMCAASALRSVGDARRSMAVTMAGAIVNAVLDPIFIFGFGWGIEGAALASLSARIVLVITAFGALIKYHKLLAPMDMALLTKDLPAIVKIAGPAMLTNLATPIGSSYVIKMMSTFGDSAVAGASILGRIVPVAFVAVYALSGAIGPIVGQNAGAGQYGRVRRALLDAMLVNVVYVLLIWLMLFIAADWIVLAFDAEGQSAYLIRFFCQWLVIGFVFNGMLFIANASFNNLNRAYVATVFNFCRALLGTIPLVYLFSRWYGPVGVIGGELAGGLLFSLIACAVLWAYINRLEHLHRSDATVIS